MSTPDVSIVVPVRDEAGNIGPLIEEIREVLDATRRAWELFVVDDGSTDFSAREIDAATAADRRVACIRHPAGRGKSAALTAGFARCSGRFVVMLDGDGQDDPAEIPGMLARLETSAAGRARVDLVNGWKTPRLDPWHKTLPSRVFNALVGLLTGLHLHDHNCGLKAFRREVFAGLPLETGMHRFMPVLAAARGYRTVEMPVHHRRRRHGRSKYGVSRFFAGLFDLVRVATRVRGRGLLAARAVSHVSRGRLRRGVYLLFAMLAAGAVLGRIGSVASVDKLALEKRLVSEAVAAAAAAGREVDRAAIQAGIEREKRLLRPFLSANDRSRWLTIRALVERGTFAIDELIGEPGWDTIDAVAHADADGRMRLYSSKPPLLSTLCAGPYWLLHAATGWTLGDHPFELGRGLMVVFGLVPLLVTIVFTCRLVDATGTTDWGRLWAAALISGGTLLTTFAVVLTNHLPAAACTAASAWYVRRVTCDGVRSRWTFAAAGATAALAAAFELPALAWCAAVFALVAAADVGRTVAAALPAAALVAAAAVGTNWLAHGTPVPAYAHRTAADNWYDYEFQLPNGKVLTSYWRNPQGVDRGEAAPAAYAWHALVGHHGIFSLTPAWLLVIPGIVSLSAGTRRTGPGERHLALAIAAVSMVVVAFYLTRSQPDRNYGGVSSGFRWVFWLAPLWVMAAVPAADRLAGGRVGRGFAALLLGASVASVAYPAWNPWTHPWIWQWMAHSGWPSPS
ncbi:MAG: glycosyltransferase [Planctomycetia bacterium]|nr:glycosyltransferase [Planctomycetia bacterium]